MPSQAERCLPGAPPRKLAGLRRRRGACQPGARRTRRWVLHRNITRAHTTRVACSYLHAVDAGWVLNWASKSLQPSA